MGVREGWKRYPGGGRARATRGGRVRVGGVSSDWWDGSYWGEFGLSSPVYLITLDWLT